MADEMSDKDLTHIQAFMEGDSWAAAILDLWACIGVTEVKYLQPATVRLAQELHERYEHPDHEH